MINNIPLPPHDKLKHFFVGTLIFVALSIFVIDLYALATVFTLASLKEVYDAYISSNNTLKEHALDLFYSVIVAFLITVLNAINFIPIF